MDVGSPTIPPYTNWTFSTNFPLPYRVLFVSVFGLWAWATNVHFLSLFSIDVPTVLSFHVDKTTTSYKPIYSIALILSIWIAGNFWVFRVVTNGDVAAVGEWTVLPLICYAVVFGMLLCPFDVIRRRERFKFMRCLRRVLFSGFQSEVHFSDTILADILTSFAKVLGDLYVSACILLFITADGGQNFSANRCWSYAIAPLFTSFPYLVRFRQCIAEYWASNGTKKRHLFNALKYASAFPVILFSALQKHYATASEGMWIADHNIHTLWLISVAINSMYSFYWDVAMDWQLNFFTPSSPKTFVPSFSLRPTLTFEPLSYYFAILLDFVLRFTWSLKISSHLHVIAELEAGVFMMEVLEVVRRWMWIFFRLESVWAQEGGIYGKLGGQTGNKISLSDLGVGRREENEGDSLSEDSKVEDNVIDWEGN